MFSFKTCNNFLLAQKMLQRKCLFQHRKNVYFDDFLKHFLHRKSVKKKRQMNANFVAIISVKISVFFNALFPIFLSHVWSGGGS